MITTSCRANNHDIVQWVIEKIITTSCRECKSILFPQQEDIAWTSKTRELNVVVQFVYGFGGPAHVRSHGGAIPASAGCTNGCNATAVLDVSRHAAYRGVLITTHRYSKPTRQAVLRVRNLLSKRSIGLSGPREIQAVLGGENVLAQVPSTATIEHILHAPVG